MRCRKCGQKAVINLRQHRLSLCRDHFLEWIPEQTALQIKKYRMLAAGEKVLVAVSGGKDSLALWDILNRLGVLADGLYIDLGIKGPDDYSASSRRLCEKFADERGLNLRVFHFEQEYGRSIPGLIDLSRQAARKPCSNCGLVKRYIMNSYAWENGYACIATGHNLDDEASVLFSNTLTWSTDRIERQYPVLPENRGLVKKIKPLHHFYERETTAYTLLRGIEYIQDECPFSTGNLTNENKEILNTMENDRPGTKMVFYTSFLRAQKDGRIGAISRPIHTDSDDAEYVPCTKCGQPTITGGLCSFCRLFT